MAHTILDVIRKLPSILKGFWNNLFTSKAVKLMAQERMEICNKCPHIDKEGSKCFMPGTQPCCSLCGCNLKLKTHSPGEHCDDFRWVDRKDIK